MYGKCKECAKRYSCHKPMSYKFGFCETDFEPKEKLVVKPTDKGMGWKQLASTKWEAAGKLGKFVIEHRRGRFWSRYASEDVAFNMPPKSKLSEAKDMCENNEYWEEVI